MERVHVAFATVEVAPTGTVKNGNGHGYDLQSVLVPHLFR